MVRSITTDATFLMESGYGMANLPKSRLGECETPCKSVNSDPGHPWCGVAIVSLAMLAFGLLCGCGVGKPVLVGERPEVKQLTESGFKALGCPVRVLPARVAITDAPDVENGYAAQGNARALELHKASEEVIGEFKLFGPVVSGEEAASAYLEVQLEVTKFDLAYEGRNAAYVPNLVWWWFSPWASWLVADENYSAGVGVKLSVRDADTGEEVWAGFIEAQVVKRLDDYQRGTKWFSIYDIGELTEDNWSLVEATLQPHIVEEFKAVLLGRLLSPEAQETLNAAAEVIRHRRLPAADCAFVVGINSCPQLGENQPKWCVESAKKFAAVLKKAGYRVEEQFEGKFATIRAAIRKMSSQTEFRVRRLVFYFAGVGASEYKKDKKAVENYLVDYGGEKLSLAEVDKLLKESRAKERVIILDAGFVGDSLGRGLTIGKIPQGAEFKFPEELRAGGCAFLSACGPGQGAAEDEKLKLCLFTHYMLKVLNSGKCDRDRDGAVSLREIAESEPVHFDLARYTNQKHGKAQTPFLGEKLRDSAVIKTGK